MGFVFSALQLIIMCFVPFCCQWNIKAHSTFLCFIFHYWKSHDACTPGFDFWFIIIIINNKKTYKKNNQYLQHPHNNERYFIRAKESEIFNEQVWNFQYNCIDYWLIDMYVFCIRMYFVLITLFTALVQHQHKTKL